MKKIQAVAAAGVFAAMLAGASTASAAIVLTSNNGPAQINYDPVDDVAGDDFINGFLNNSTIGVLVEGHETLTTSNQGGGVVWITPTDPTGFNYLKFSLVGHTFTAFEVDLKDPTGANPKWSVTLTTNNGTTTTFDHFNGGYVSAYTTAGEQLTSVEFSTSADIAATGQTRFDGIDGGAIPEPATWALMILGFGGAGAMLRRRRTVVA